MIAYDINTAEPVNRQKSPLEENVWFMPADCTDVEPPSFDASIQTCQFKDGAWEVKDIPVEKEPEEPETVDLAEPAPHMTKIPDPDYVPDYKAKRMEEYGDTYSQLQFLAENGIEAFQKRVQDIKSKFPKPE